MKKIGILFVLLVILISPAAAADGDISVGLGLGQPSGLTGKYVIDDQLSANMLLAFRFGSATTGGAMSIRTAVSYNVTEVAIENAYFYPYVGGGVDVMIGNDAFGLGAVAPVGFSYYFDDPPIELYAEVVPGVSFTQGTDPFYVGGGIGGRYRLGR